MTLKYQDSDAFSSAGASDVFDTAISWGNRRISD